MTQVSETPPENKDPRLKEGKPVQAKDSKELPANPFGDLADNLKKALDDKGGKTQITPENAGPYTVASLQSVIREQQKTNALLAKLCGYFEKLKG